MPKNPRLTTARTLEVEGIGGETAVCWVSGWVMVAGIFGTPI